MPRPLPWGDDLAEGRAKGSPPTRTPRRGGAAAVAEPYTAHRYRAGRHWCVMHQGAELVAVVTYKRGAAELVRRLNAAGAAGGAT